MKRRAYGGDPEGLRGPWKLSLQSKRKPRRLSLPQMVNQGTYRRGSIYGNFTSLSPHFYEN